MLTLDRISSEIERVSDELEQQVQELTQAADTAAITESTFKAEFAKARLKARYDANVDNRRITVDEVTDLATVATAELRQGYLIGQNLLTVNREALRAKQARLDALRTLSAGLRGSGG